MEEIVRAYLKAHSLIESNIHSFDDFIERKFQAIVDQINEELPRNEVNLFLGKVRVGKPQVVEADGSVKPILPIEARLRKLNYAGPIYLEVSTDGKEYQELEIGQIPVMVKSKLCHLSGKTREELIQSHEDPDDPGGYFIINGNERVAVLLEDLATNQPLIERKEKELQLRLFSARGSYRIPLTISQSSDGLLMVQFSRFRNLPVLLLIKALGLLKDESVAALVGPFDSLLINLYEFAGTQSSEDALLKIAELMQLSGTKREMLDRVKLRIDSALLPHLGTKPEQRKEKALTLCKLLKLFLKAKQIGYESDKDHYMNKRVKLAGELLTDLFRVNLTIFVRDLQYNLQKAERKKKVYSLKSLAKSTLFSHRIETAFATGNWIGQRTGVTQNMDKTNRLAIISQLHRVVSLLSTEQENFKARTLHPTHFGRFCPIETPEGTEIGLRKNLALLARITTDPRVSEESLLKVFKSCGLKEAKESEKEEAFDVFLNGKWIGTVSDSNKFFNSLKVKRASRELPTELGIRFDRKLETFFLSTDVGRVQRPLLVVKEGKPLLKQEHLEAVSRNELSWDDLLNLGLIEWLDVGEEDSALVALTQEELTPEHTHLEIDPATLYGVLLSLVPYSNHDQSSRLGKVGRTSKQALSLYSANFPVLMDTDVSVLHYPQQPLVRSFLYDQLKYPFGQNMVVAIAPYEGYNMSDAIVLNEGSVQRGLGRSTYFRPYETVEIHYTGRLKDEIEVPTKDLSGYRTEKAYKHLEDDGLVYPEAELNEGDVVIGKSSPPKFMLEMEEVGLAKTRKENSVAIKQAEKGIADAVFLTTDGEGRKIARVRVRDQRIPELGDKYASPHGQKGVIGFIVPEADMPFTAEGIKPDLMFNPHGIPSRMTVGYLIELLAGKVSSLNGNYIDGTAFKPLNVKDLEEQLRQLGFREDGKQTLYDGKTGKALKAKVFIGNMYYLKLRYMAANKIQVRASGKVTLLTRQPIEGRAKGGALRIGEMEKDTFVAHGASLLLKERFSSDNVQVLICPKCGSFGIEDKLRKRTLCPFHEAVKLEPVQISYGSKLLFEELTSLHLFPQFKLKNKYED